MFLEPNRGTGAQSGTVKSTGCDPLEEMKYLLTFIFSLLRSGVAASRGVEFRHSTRNASRTR